MKRRAERAHVLRIARLFGARRDDLRGAGSGDREWHVRGVRRGEERLFVVVPVDEYLARCGEHVGCPALF